MTAAVSVPRDPQVHAAQVLSEADYALIGAQAAQAGFSQSQISRLLATVERAALQAAQVAARQTAMAIVPELMATIRDTHTATAQRIATQIGNLTGGWGGQTVHRRCVQIAMQEMLSTPAHRVIEPR